MQMPTTKSFKDLTSQIIGKLTVIEYHGCSKYYASARKHCHEWLCLCNCGNTTVVSGDNLRSGKTISCGCYQKSQTSHATRVDLQDKTFGELTVLKFAHTKKGQTFWTCRCNCGTEKDINAASLKRGSSKSCGCKRGNFTHGLWGKPGYKSHYLSDPVKKLKHNVSVAVRDVLKGRKKRLRTFDHLPYSAEELKIHLESQFEAWMSWDNYGGSNDSKQNTWQIDHIIPQASFNYSSLQDQQFLECWSLSNLRPLEKKENMIKGSHVQ